jgi:Nucleotidyl transferase AbiEii toxin, Type IV TA system
VRVAYKPPAGPPPSAGVLAKYVLAYARASNLAEGRVRAWISYMITAGMLERATTAGQLSFVIKGGVALELRLRNRARATKDLDVALHHTDADLAVTLERALTSEPYQGFSFRSKRPPLVLDNGVVNMEFAVSYRGGAWASISIDVARNESGEHEIEWLPAIPLTDTFGVTGPNALPCLPLCHHIAQKLHGMTLPPRPGKRNERFRDLIDLLLMESLVIEYGDLRKTCEHVFETRGTHPWPPPLDLPEHWIDPINRLIGELELPIADAQAGLARVRQFVDRILSSAEVIDGNLR